MRFLFSLIFLILSISVHAEGPSFYVNSQFAGLYPSLGLQLHDGKKYFSLSVDPTVAPGVSAPIGSIGPRDNSGTGELWYKFGSSDTQWTNVLFGNTGWQLLGNSGTVAGTNFLGTTDSQDLIFKTNNSSRLTITAAGDYKTNLSSGALTTDPTGKITSTAAGSYGNILYSNGTGWISSPLPQVGKFVVYVDPNGNNSNCAVGRIDLPCADPAGAMSIISGSDSTHMYTIMMYPGIYTVATLALKAYVSLVGLAGSYQTSGVFLQVTGGNITLDASLAGVNSVNLIKGFQLISTGLNFDVAALGAGHTHIFTVDSMHGANAVTFKAASTSDTFNMSNSLFSNGNLLCSGGFVNLNAGTVFYANATFNTATAVNATHYIQQAAIYGTANFASTGGNSMFGVLYSTSLGSGLTISGANTQVYPDEISVPLKSTVSFSGGAVDITNMIRQSDAFGAAYGPTVAGDWASTPNTIQNSLDLISARGIVKNENANLVFSGPSSGGAALPTFRSLVNSDFPTSGVTAGSYTNSNVTVNAQGIITGIGSGSGSSSSSSVFTEFQLVGGVSNQYMDAQDVAPSLRTTSNFICSMRNSGSSGSTIVQFDYGPSLASNILLTITANGGLNYSTTSTAITLNTGDYIDAQITQTASGVPQDVRCKVIY